MNQQLPDLLALNLFRWTARDGTLTAAAARLGIGQPHASRVLANLQRRLGVTLLVKSGKRLEPTDTGLHFLEEVEHALQNLDSVWTNANAIAHGSRRPIRLLVQSHLAHGLMPSVLALLRVRAPMLRFDLEMRQKTRLSEWASRVATDAILTTYPVSPRLGEAVPLFKTRYLLAAPRSSPMAARSEIRVAEVAALPFIDVRPGLSTHDRLQEMAARQGAQPHIVMVTGSVMSAAQLAAEGIGYALIDPFLAHLSSKDERVRFLHIVDGPELSYCLVAGDPHVAWVPLLKQAVVDCARRISLETIV